MESPRRSSRNTFSIPSRSKIPRDHSKQSQEPAPKVADRPDLGPAAAKSLNDPKPSRASSVRKTLRQSFSRLRASRLPVSQQRNKQPPEDPPDLFSQELMNMIEQQVARNIGGPVRQPQAVIDLTSDDEEDDFFEDAQELADERNGHRIKRERHEARNDLRQELEERMGDPREFGQAEQLHDPPAIPDNPFARVRDVWGDYDLDEDFDDEIMAGAFDFDQEYPILPTPAAQHRPQASPAIPALQEHIPEEIMETRVDCVDTVVNVFPDICRDYVSELYDKVSQSSERLIAHILDKMDKGSSYPNAKEKQKQLKRKREIDEDAEAARKYGAPDRIMPTTVGGIRSFM